MNKIVIAVLALVAIVGAEPPSSYGAPSLGFLSSGGGGGGFSGGYDDGGNDGAQYVDGALLQRVAQIIEQNEGSSRGGGFSRGYSQPSDSYGPPSSSYGAPARFGGGGGGFGLGGISLGRPERAQRVAEFSTSSGGGGFGGFRGGFSSGGYN